MSASWSAAREAALAALGRRDLVAAEAAVRRLSALPEAAQGAPQVRAQAHGAGRTIGASSSSVGGEGLPIENYVSA